MQGKTKKRKVSGVKNAKTINPKSRIWRNGAPKLNRRNKPECTVVKVGGKLRVLGQSDAAKWLGMSRMTFVGAIQGRTDLAKETIDLVRREYPELFA